ncbi:MAG: glycosyltransferase family 2 protein [Nitrospirota bacterium]
MNPLISIIIINWNGWKDTLRCLESLCACSYKNFSVTVLDNGSTDGSFKMLNSRKEGFGFQVKLLRSKVNTGFTGGCNIAVKKALEGGCGYVFLLNNDAAPHPDALSHMVEVSKKTGAAIVGARILDMEGKKLIFEGRRWPLLIFGLGKINPDREKDFWETDYAEGSALLIRRDAVEGRIKERGYFLDESFFMYGEETDFCVYSKRRGHKCMIAAKAKVYHGVAKSSGGHGSLLSYYYITRNRIFLANRWLSLPWKILFHLYYIPSRLLIQSPGFLNGKKEIVSAVFRGLSDGYSGINWKWRRHA